MPPIHCSRQDHPLTEWRLRHKVSLKALAARVLTNPQTIHRYECGDRVPAADLRALIQSATNGEVPADGEFWAKARERAAATRVARADERKRKHPRPRPRWLNVAAKAAAKEVVTAALARMRKRRKQARRAEARSA